MRDELSITLLTPQEVSDLFKIPVAQIQKLAREGKLPAIKVGRLWRFRQADIWRYIEGNWKVTPDMVEIHEKAFEIVKGTERR